MFIVNSGTTSATRFVEIVPLWQNIESIWKYFVDLFSIWQNFEPILANFHGCKWPNIEQIILQYGHTGPNVGYLYGRNSSLSVRYLMVQQEN